MTAAAPARPARTPPAISNELLGTLFFLGAEAMFFLGLVFAAVHLHHVRPIWPPPGSPPLDLALLVFNTAVLFGSCLTLVAARRALGGSATPAGSPSRDAGIASSASPARAVRRLGATIALGGLFLAGQAFEFARLGGWRPTESLYRTLFDVIAGLHGLHVLAGLVILAVVAWRVRLGQITPARPVPLVAASWYWLFVSVVWLWLFATLLHIS